MKLFLLTLFVAAATTSPIPDEAVDVIVNGLPEGHALDVEDILGIKVNEHVDGQLVSASNALYPYSPEAILAAIAAEVAESELSLPEAVVLPEPAVPEVLENAPEAVVLPAPATPELVDESLQPAVLPAPALPESNPESVVAAPEPVVLPQVPGPEMVVAQPEALETPEVVEAPVMPVEVVEQSVDNSVDVVDNSDDVVDVLDNVNEVINTVEEVQADALVGEVYNDGTVQVNVNAETGILATLQSWFDMAINYVNSSGAQTTQQII